MESNKKEPWRIIAFIIAVIFIIYMLVTKNNDADTALTAEQAAPAMITSVAVTVVKFAIIAAVVFIGKHIIGKIRSKKKE